MRNLWIEEEDNFLRENYQLGDKDYILKNLPNRKWKQIHYRCSTELKIKRLRKTPCNVSWILNDDLITYYWIGFILADGHISKDNSLKVLLSMKDEDHLKKLCDLFNYKFLIEKRKNDYEYCCLYIKDIIFRKIAEKFDIRPRKTYEPPNPSIIPNNDLGLALLIGFIDGDGNINERGHIRIKNHLSWKSIHERFCEILGERKELSKVNNYGYAQVSFCKIATVNRLYEFAVKNQLPIMERKWNKYD